VNRFAEQQSRWGFVPGEEDTLNINMNMPGGVVWLYDSRVLSPNTPAWLH
jgi:hypothetical protein